VKTKWTLSTTEQQDYNVNVQRLMAAGVIPRQEQTASEPPMLTLERTGGIVDSFIHATRTRGYGMVVWVRIVVLKSGISLSECRVKPRRWEDIHIQLVDATEGSYSYARTVGVEYSRTDVLNPWISSNRYLSRGKILKGLVMAHSPVPLPAWCVDGISIEADLILLDQFDNPYSLDVELRVMRDAERSVDRPRRTGLFGPAVASRNGTCPEESDSGCRGGISPKEPSVRATK
jgi:hypothetical protein